MKNYKHIHVNVLKGLPDAFTCLGNWYALNNKDSMASLYNLLNAGLCQTDKNNALDDLGNALLYYATNKHLKPWELPNRQ